MQGALDNIFFGVTAVLFMKLALLLGAAAYNLGKVIMSRLELPLNETLRAWSSNFGSL